LSRIAAKTASAALRQARDRGTQNLHGGRIVRDVEHPFDRADLVALEPPAKIRVADARGERRVADRQVGAHRSVTAAEAAALPTCSSPPNSGSGSGGAESASLIRCQPSPARR
jgi:hypothetical protein